MNAECLTELKNIRYMQDMLETKMQELSNRWLMAENANRTIQTMTFARIGLDQMIQDGERQNA